MKKEVARQQQKRATIAITSSRASEIAIRIRALLRSMNASSSGDCLSSSLPHGEKAFDLYSPD
jgi:hypothetical protein